MENQDSPTSIKNRCDSLEEIESQNITDNTDSQKNFPKYSSYWMNLLLSTMYSIKAPYYVAIFVIVFMSLGILIVAVTSPREKQQICLRTFKVPPISSVSYDSRPRFLVVVDINQDTLLDVLVANPGTDNIGIFYGNTNGIFAEQTTFPTGPGSQPYSIAVSDFNRDSRLDIVAANYGTHSIGIYFGDGNKNFTNSSIYSLGPSRPVSIAIADFNNDSFLDIVIASHGTNNVDILLAYSDGSFGMRTTYFTGYDSLPSFIITSHFNKDNTTDIAVANTGTNCVGIFLGYGNGSFAPQKTYLTGYNSAPQYLTVTDVNIDTYVDIIIPNNGSNNVIVLLGYQNGTFGNLLTYPLDPKSHPTAVVFGDFDNDNEIDVAVTDTYHDNIIIARGIIDGNFSLRETYSTDYKSLSSSIVAGDFNKDKHLDIVVANTGKNEIEVISRHLYKPFSIQVINTDLSAASPNFIVVGDFNSDNKSDLVITSDADDSMVIFLGNGNGSFPQHRKYSTGKGSGPRSVAVADFNNDDILDVATANYHGNNIAVFLGVGNGTFREFVAYSTGNQSAPSSIVTADFNSDNQSDIAVSGMGLNQIIILLGHGNGSFSQSMTYTTGMNSFPRFIAVSDVNNDNNTDIIVCKYGSFTVAIWLGYGNGTFKVAGEYAVERDSSPLWVVVNDLNNDNQIDLVTLNYPSSNITVLLGYGNGSFENFGLYSSGYHTSARSITVGDFNNDYSIDIATANYGTNSIGVLYGYGNGTYALVQNYFLGDGFQPYAILATNINNDDWLDIAITYPEVGSIGALLGLDYIYVASERFYSTGTGSHPISIAISDFNNDSKLDMAIANAGLENIDIRLGDGNGSFDIESTYSIGFHSSPEYLTTADINRDNKIDIITADIYNDTISILYGYGDGTFRRQETYSTGYLAMPNSVATGDLNHDNVTDVVVANQGTNNVGVFLSFKYVTFPNGTVYASLFDSAPYALVIGDFNNDNQSDIVITNSNRGCIGIFLGYGNGSFSSQNTYATGDNSVPIYMAVSDFDHDNHLDIVVANSAANNIGIFLGYGNGTFSPQKTHFTGLQSAPYGVATGDLNNDTHTDIIVAYHGNNKIGIFLGYGDGNFIAISELFTGAGARPIGVAISDLNNDKHLDVVVANNGNNNIGIFFGYGNGTFSTSTLYSTGNMSYPASVAIDDLNNDNHQDIVVANEGTNNIGIFFGYGNGSFAKQQNCRTGEGALSFSVAIADLNNDKHLDIVSVNFGSNNIGIFFGYGNGNFTSQLIVSTGDGSNPNGIGIADLNNDNLLDIAVPNWGTDNFLILFQYSHQPFLDAVPYSTGINSLPHWVLIGDFNNDSLLDIVVANYGTNNIGILIGDKYGTFGNQMTYSTGLNSGPSSIDQGDFNNDHRLDIVVANSISNMITIFLGYGNGTFFMGNSYTTEIDSYPRMVLAYDIDKNGQLDIIVTNIVSNKILVYSGYGNGSFYKSNSYKMGVNAQPYAIGLGDFNNDTWIDMAVANYGTDNVNILIQEC